MKSENKTITFTYIGTIQIPNETETRMLDELMKKFQSGKRFLRERILEGKHRKESVEMAKPLFLSNSRYMRDAFLEAEASISSQKELLPLYVMQTEGKIKKLEQKLKAARSKTTNTEKQKKQNEQRIVRLQNKIKKLIKQKRYYEYHIEHNTIPKIVDGSKQKFRLLQKGKLTNQEWKDLRSNSLYSRGEKSKGGNENTKLVYIGENNFEIAILNPLGSKRNDRLRFTVCFPEKFVFFIASYLSTGEAYSIRLKRRNGRYEVHVTLEEDVLSKPNFSKGVAGMDINPDNLSVTIVYPNGNFRASKVFWMHELNTVRSVERDTLVQRILYEVMSWIQSYDIDTLVIENLKFLQSAGSKGFNRMSHNFSYSKIIKSLLSVSYKENVALLQVDAYYSSFIGRVKYQQTYGLSVHQAAAFVLARRGLGYEEKIPKEYVPVLFAKEAKQGIVLSKLFAHWKKLKAWYDDVIEELETIGIKTKTIFFKDIYTYKTSPLPF